MGDIKLNAPEQTKNPRGVAGANMQQDSPARFGYFLRNICDRGSLLLRVTSVLMLVALML